MHRITQFLRNRPVCSWSCRQLSTGNDAITSPLHFLNGERIQPAGSRKVPVFNPATGEVLCEMPESNRDDITSAVQSCRDAFAEWSSRSGRQRGEVLLKASQIIKDNLEDISRLESVDNGKPIYESRMDTEGCAESLAFFGGVAPTIAGRHVQLPDGSFGYTRREPLGVIGAIGAFNYPFQMACWKSGPALACGNTMVFKPSPLTPFTAVVLGEIYKLAGLPDGCFNVVQGETDAGKFLSSDCGVAKMTFTGSVATGSKVMETCAKDIRNVTLELGGKSPLLIFDDCDLENAVKGAMMANFLTQGQVCSNGTRVYVHEKIKERFVSRLLERTKSIKLGNPLDDATRMGAMISPAQAQKVLNYIDIAKKEGGHVLTGGERVTPAPELAGGWYISPCIIDHVADHMTVAQEEIFGPVACIFTFKDEDDVIRRANASEYGLAAGIFTNDLKRAHRVAARLETGNVYVNNYNIFPAELPFGGNKKSGIGREGGIECLEYFTQVKTVHVESGDVWCPY